MTIVIAKVLLVLMCVSGAITGKPTESAGMFLTHLVISLACGLTAAFL